MPTQDPLLYVWHIKEACERILSYTADTQANWPYGSMVIDAVCRNLQILREAARKLDAEFKDAHPEVPWRSTIGLRNVITHEYDTVIPEVIREVVERDIPPLLASMRRLLEPNAR